MLKKIIYKLFLPCLVVPLVASIPAKVSSEKETNAEIIELTDESNIKLMQPKIEIIGSIDELMQYFNSHITYDDLKYSLRENPNINDEYRHYTEEFIDLVSMKFPNVDLTVFNENLKFFQLKEIEKKQMQQDDKKTQACYKFKETAIYMHDEYSSIAEKKYCYFHELWHMFCHLYLQKGDTIYYKNTSSFIKNATPIDEGMTTFLTETIYKVPGLSSYPNQLDIIQILYEIYKDDLIDNYLNYGVEGIQNLIEENSDIVTAATLFDLMAQQQDGTLKDPYPIYEILISLCKDDTNYYNISKILKNINYNNEEKQPIMDMFYENIYSIELDQDTKVTFNNQDYYNATDMFYVELENTGSIYLIDNNIMSNFFYTGYIHNIYDDEQVYARNDRLLMRETFGEYFKLQNIQYEYDDVNDILVIDKEEIRGVSYVKSK